MGRARRGDIDGIRETSKHVPAVQDAIAKMEEGLRGGGLQESASRVRVIIPPGLSDTARRTAAARPTAAAATGAATATAIAGTSRSAPHPQKRPQPPGTASHRPPLRHD